jgi:hypothetical protein
MDSTSGIFLVEAKSWNSTQLIELFMERSLRSKSVAEVSSYSVDKLATSH